jgi:TctA family transporter
MVLASQSALLSFAIFLFGWAMPTSYELIIIVCSLIIGNVITHTFLDFIPSVFLGAPEGETALSLLPGHRMMLAGRGYEAVKCSVIGSFGAVIGALALLVPMRLILGSPINAYEALASWMHLLLIGVSVFLIMTETARPADKIIKQKDYEMTGFVLLSDVRPGEAIHTGQKVTTLAELSDLTSEEVAISAKVIQRMVEKGKTFLVLEEEGKRINLTLLSEPPIVPEPGSRVVAIGRIMPVITWKHHLVKRVCALGVFLLAGLLGTALLMEPALASKNIFIFKIPTLDQGTMLFFPLFTGLFGLSTMLLSMKDNPKIPEQKVEGVKVKVSLKKQTQGITSGCIASIASWFPGISGAISTIISVFLNKGSRRDEQQKKGDDTETQEFIISVSAVNTSVALFNLMALFVIMKSRSGAMKAVEGLMADSLSPWEPLWNMPLALSALLLSAVVATIVAIFLALFFGKMFAKYCSKMNYSWLIKTVSIFLIIMVAIFSGGLGLVILGIATCIGMIPPMIGVKRVHLMGCLIVPIILYFL